MKAALARFPETARKSFGLIARAFESVGEDGEGLLDRVLARFASGPIEPKATTSAWTVFDAFVEEYAASMPPLSAVRAGHAVPYNAYEIIDFLATSAGTLREGFERLGRYLRLARPKAAFAIDETGPRPRVVLRDDQRDDDWFLDEWTIGVTLRGFRGSLGPSFGPSAWGLRRSKPQTCPSLVDAIRLVGVAPSFGERAAFLTFEPEAWSVALPTHSPHIQSTLLAYAEAQLAEQRDQATLRDRVRGVLAQVLQSGEPTIEHVAKRLATTPRTLQRRLREESTSFQAVLDGLRAELAKRYLDEGRFELAEVAFLLGYAEASAFARAFRRWHGVSPTRRGDQS
jgi:AraC-like DNA-binding protein